jgi:hypothetical protein
LGWLVFLTLTEQNEAVEVRQEDASTVLHIVTVRPKVQKRSLEIAG